MDTKYLKLKDKTWLFRIKIPKEFQFYFEGKREFLKSTGASELDLAKAQIKRNAWLGAIKLKFNELKKEMETGAIKTPQEKLIIENKLKIEKARQETPDLLSEVQHQAVEDALQFVDLNKSQKSNPDMVDAILKSDTTGKAKNYIEAISNEKFNSFFNEFENEMKRDRQKAKGIDQKMAKLKDFSKYHSTIKGIDRPKVINYKNYLFDKRNLSSKTISGYLQSLGQYWDFLADAKGIKDAQLGNPFRNIKLPQHIKAERLTWRTEYFEDSVDDVKELLESERKGIAELIEDLGKEEVPDVAEIQKLVTVAGYLEDRLAGKYT